MTKISYTNLTKEEVLKRTKEILPLVIEKAKTVEKERKPDDEVIRRFAEAGIYAACVPKRFGGAELNFDTMIAVTRMIARDLNLLSVHGFMDWDTARENWGRVWLGLPPNTPII